MSHTITRRSIWNYRDAVRPDITEVCWRAGPLDQSVFANLPNLETLICTGNKLTSIDLTDLCPKLRTLDCSANRIRSGEDIKVNPNLTTLLIARSSLRTIKGIHDSDFHYLNLRTLDCSSTKLTTLEGIEACTQIETLECSKCRLTTLTHLTACPNLQELDCIGNQLVTLEGLEGLEQLVRIYCQHNQLTSLSALTGCTGLKILKCYNNRLTTLDGLQTCTSLCSFNCSSNRLTTLEGLQTCIALNGLDCSNNQIHDIAALQDCTALVNLNCHSNLITSLDAIAGLRNLRVVNSQGNPLEIQRAAVMDMIDGLEPQLGEEGGIYNDDQSVHDPHIQQSVRRSVANLMCDPGPMISTKGILVTGLSHRANVLLHTYRRDFSVHTTFKLTYTQLLAYVWARIEKSEHKAELIKILEEQIIDAEGMCFTGRFNRTLSVLVGFYPDITIEIAGSAQINAIIAVTQRQVIPYSAAKHIALAKTRLEELGLGADKIQPWLDAIQEASE